MFCLKYRICNEMPLVLTSKAGDPNIVATERYIPGTSVLGLLAKRYLDRHPQVSAENACDDPYFHDCFVNGRITFGPAYLSVQDAEGQRQTYLPVPLSVRRKKYADDLYDFLYKKEEPLLRTTAVKGFCSLGNGVFQNEDVVTTLNFHHARDRKTGTTDGEKIFTYEAIKQGHCFEGCILGNYEDLQHLLAQCDTQWDAYLGRSKNTQYGKVRFFFLQEEAQEYASDSTQLERTDKAESISLSLLSDTIIYNEYGFPSTDSHDLTTYLTTLLGSKVRIKKARTRQGHVENFVGVWRLRTPSEQCFQAGSSFLLSMGNCDPKRLSELETSGIGERTHQGFGRCRFAWQTDHPLITQSRPEISPSRPAGHVPEMTREILKTLVVQALEKDAEFLAIQAQKDFRLLPSNSLLGRLENVMSNSSGKQQWIDFLKELRNTAKKQLENCHNTRKTLLQYLIEENINIPTVIEKSQSKLQELLEEFSLKLENEDELNTRLYQRYWGIFLAMMRKRKNKEGGERSS